MKPNTIHRTGYFLIAFQVINFVWMAFYPGLLMAASAPEFAPKSVKGTSYKIVNGKLVLPDNTLERQRAMNQGQAFGAKSISNFSLPTVNDANVPDGYNPATGEYDGGSTGQYTDDTKKHLKNEVYLQQMFSGYDKDAVTDYVNSLSGVVDDPTLVNDQVAQIKQEHAEVEKDTYTNCKGLEGGEYRKCLMYLTTSFIEGGALNEGKKHFAKENDPIMLASASLIDGEHPFYDELLSGECKEVTSTTNPEDTYSLTERKVCIRQGEPLDMYCNATRKVVTSPVASKILIKSIVPEPGVVISSLTGEKLVFESCGSEPKTFDSVVGTKIVDTACLMVTLGTGNNLNHFTCPNHQTINHRKSGFLLQLDEGIQVDTLTLNSEFGGRSKIEYGMNDTSYDLDYGIPPNQNAGCQFNEDLDTDDEFPGVTLGEGKGTNTLFVNFEMFASSMNDGYARAKIRFVKAPVNEGTIVHEDIIASRFLGNLDEYPKKENTWLFGEETLLHYDVFEVDDYPVNEFLPTNLRLEVQGYTNYYQYTDKKASCNKEYFKGTDGSSNISGSLYGDGLNGYQCRYEVPCTEEEAVGNWAYEAGVCAFARDLEVTCPQGFSQSNIYANKCVKSSGAPEMCSVLSPADYTCPSQIHGGTSVSGSRQADMCHYQTISDAGNCAAGWQHDLANSSQCVKTTNITNMCPTGSYPSESDPSQCYTVDGASCPTQTPFNFSFDVFSYGRATNLWDYQVVLSSNKQFPFVVKGDMHKVDIDEFVPDDTTPDCQIVIDNYVENKFVSEARCLEDLGTRFGVGGIEFNNHSTKGLVDTLLPWGTDIGEPLLQSCWTAELILKTKDQEQIGTSPENCIGLGEYDYNNCINGEFCKYDDINGQEVCYPLGSADEGSLLGNSCKALEDNPECTEVVSELRCEEYGIDSDGSEVCIYQSAVFECKVGDSEYSLPGKEEGEIVCGAAVECMGGSCSNITEEKNEDFGEAAVMTQVAEEIKKSADCASDPVNCKVFSGTSNTCAQPQMWGADDCCDPDSLGMGGMDTIATLKAMKYIYDLGENEVFMGYMSESWTGFSGVLQDIGAEEVAEMAEAGVEMVSSTMSSASGAASDVYDSIAEPISTAFTDVLKEFGFDTAESVLPAATAAASEAAAESIFSGLSQYIANGVYAFVEFFIPGMAEQLFTVVAIEGTDNYVVTGLANEGANEALGAILEMFSFIMMVYAIYNITVGIVFGCQQQDFETTQKIKLMSTHYSHSFCDTNSILGCMSYTQVHCLYESPFTRIISEQIRMQEAKNKGVDYEEVWRIPSSKVLASCDGFTIEELGQVDWDEVDLSEYLEIMMAGYFENDPANLPESFISSEKGAGGRTGPSSGTTNVQSNINAINVIAGDVDTARGTLANQSLVLTNPEFMPWYKQPKVSPGSDAFHCRMSCSEGFGYDSDTQLCVKDVRTEVGGTVSCNSGYSYNSTEESCIKKVVSSVLPGCQEGYTLSDVDGLCHRPDVIIIDSLMSCPPGSNYREDINKCEQYEQKVGSFSCESHGSHFTLLNTCPALSAFDEDSGKCVGDNISESPIRKCVDSISMPVAPKLSCPVTDTLAPDAEGNCLAGFNYNTALDQCEKSRYTLDGDICKLVINKNYTKSCPDGELYDDVTDKCVLTSLSNYPATVSCPAGFDMQDTLCIKSDTVAGTPTCDVANGFIKVGDKCEKSDVSYSPVSAYCSGDYRLSEDKLTCVKAVLSTPLPPVCETGFVLAGNLCTKTSVEQISASQVCSQGFTYNITTDACERLSQYTPQLTCDEVDGYKLNGITGQCEKTTSSKIDATQICAPPSVAGTGDYENYCHTVVVSDALFTCKSGFVYDEVTSLCTMQSTIVNPASVACPAGFQPSSGECIKVTKVDSIKSCPDGSTFDPTAGKCEKLTETVVALIPYCEPPTVLENGQCIEKFFTLIEGVCPDPTFTYNADSKTCAKIVSGEVPPIELCGSGGEVEGDGSCTSGYSVPALADCGEGYYYDALGDACIQQQGEIVPGAPQCLDAGFILDGASNLCVKESITSGDDCPTGFVWNDVLSICLKQETRNPTFACPNSYAYDGTNCVKTDHVSFSCPTGTVYDAALKACSNEESFSAILDCKDGYNFNGTACISEVTHTPICSQGLVYNDAIKLCETQGTIDVTTSCPLGYSDNNGNCSRISEANAGCNIGFTLDADSNTCKRNVSELAQTYCFKGSDTGTNCEIKESLMPTCEADHHFNSSTQTCEKQTRIEGELYCPELLGFESEISSEQRCAYFEVRQPNGNGDCPNGYSIEGGQCFRFSEFKPPFYLCPEGYTQETLDSRDEGQSTQCLLLETKAPECELGFTYTAGYCVKSHFSDYDLSCNDGLVLESGNCVANETQSILCLAGSSYSATVGKCLTIITVDYNLTCPNHYTVSGLTCVSSFTESPACNSGFSFDTPSGMCKAHSQAPQCIADYVYDPSLDKCKKDEQLNADGYCDADKFDTGTGCVEYSPASCTAAGYSLNTTTDLCEKFETKAEEDLCAADEVDNGSGCIKVEVALCPANHALNPTTDRCEYTEIVVANYTCAADEVDTGVGCQKVEAPGCPSGYVFSSSNDRCEKFESKSANASCEADWLDVGTGCQKFTAPICNDSNYSSASKQCVKNLSYDMTYHCGVGDVDTGTGCSATKAPICNAGFTYYGERDQCEQLVSIPADETCPTDSYDNGYGCVAFSEATCAAGLTFDFSTGKCRADETMPATGVCSSGTDTGSGCRVIETSSPNCPVTYSYNATSNKCQKTLTTSADGNCGSGSDTGAGCQVTETKAPPCPTGYSYNTTLNKCAKTLTNPAEGVCATGTDTGSGCQTIETKLPPCPSSYSYNNSSNKCEKTLTTSADGNCSAGTDTGSGCSVVETKTPVCPSTYLYNPTTNKCEKTLTTPADGNCTSGSNTGEGCFEIETKQPPCPNTYTYNPTSNRCEKTLTTSADGVCATGTDNGSGCSVIEIKQPPCPNTYTYNPSSNRCEKTLTTDADGNCSSGSNNGNGCSVLETKPITCSSGYTYNSSSNRCEKTLTTGADGTCSSGSDNGRGCSELQTKVVPCPSLHTYNGATNKCEKIDTVPVTKYCDSGYHKTLYGCKRISNSIWCTKGSLTKDGCRFYHTGGEPDYINPSCLTGYTATYLGSTVGFKCLASAQPHLTKCDAGWNKVGATCKKLVSSLTPNCGSGWSLNTSLDKCTRTVSSEYDGYKCDSGWTLSGTTCSKLVWETVNCGTGWTHNTSQDRCERTINEGYGSYSCDSGWTLSGTTCSKLAWETVNCGTGWTLNTSTDRCERTVNSGYSSYKCDSGWTLSGTTCTRVDQIYPNCGTGWTLNTSTDKCERSVNSPYGNYTCDAGWTLNGTTCSKLDQIALNCGSGWSLNTSTDLCQRTVNENYGSYSCDAGWTLNGTTCSKVERITPNCGSGWTHNTDTDICQRTVNDDYSNYTCPAGWSLSGTTCTKVLLVSPDCGSGWVFNAANDVCQRTVNSGYDSYSCGAGWVISGTTCSKLLQVEPTCNTGWALNVSTDYCERAVNKPYDSYVCDAGWNLSGTTCTRVVVEAPICESGFTYKPVNKRCEAPAVTYDYSCLTGWTLSADSCQGRDVEPAECDPGYVLDTVADRCISSSLEPYLNNCAVSYTPNNSTMKCELYQYSVPVCSPGALNESTNTCQTTVKAYLYSCGAGFTLNGVSCERTLTAPVTCSDTFTYQNSAKQCKTAVVAYDRTCDAGFTLNGVSCEKEHIAAPICDATYSYHDANNQCQTVQTPHGYICGDVSWSHTGSSCERTLTDSPYCDAGQNYDSGNNQCQGNNLGYHYGCPVTTPSWNVVGDKCNRTLVDEVICGPGEELISDQCTVVDSNARVYQCYNDEFTLVGDSCEKHTVLSVTCADGDFSALTDDCVKPQMDISTEQCGDGWTLADGLCKKSSAVGKVLSCGAGYTQLPLSGQCSRIDHKGASYSCPPTHPIMAEGRVCEKVSVLSLPVISYSCAESNHTLDGNQCLVEGGATICENPTHELIDISLPGEEESFVCRFDEMLTQPAVYQCEYGFTLEKAGLCVKQEVTVALMKCPFNYELDVVDGQCKATHTVNVPFDLSCDPTFELSGTFCIKVEVSPSVFSCPDEGQTLVGAFCYSGETVTEDPIKICKNENAAGKCEQDVYTQPDYECPVDYTLTLFGNQCIKDSVELGVDPVGVCIDGYDFALGVCTKLDSHASMIACPDNSWTLNGTLCDRTLTETASSIICDENAIKFENRCYLKETVAITLGCTDGFLFDSINEVCTRDITRIEPILYTCLPDYNVVGELCIKVEEELVTVECLDVTHKLIGMQCYEESQSMGDPVKSCPSGYTDTGSDCTITNEFPAELSCSDSTYIYNVTDNSCNKTFEEIKSPVLECDTGFTQISTLMCQRTLVSTDPTITCPDGWSQGSGRCEQSSDIIVEQGFCQSGYQKVEGECVQYHSHIPVVMCPESSKKELSRCFLTSQETELPIEICQD